MLLDHTAYFLSLGKSFVFLRCIGRMAFPIFAYFIAEGCKHTKNRFKYFSFMFVCGLIMLLVQHLVTGEYYCNIFITFSLSILTIYILMHIKKQIFNKKVNVFKLILSIIFMFTWLYILYNFTNKIEMDYSFLGILLPVFFSSPNVYTNNVPTAVKRADNLYIQLVCGAICMAISIAFAKSWYQGFELFALLFLLLYNGKRGKYNIKYFFYIFYPLHICILYVIEIL